MWLNISVLMGIGESNMAVGFKSWSVHLEANTTKSRGLHSKEVLASYPGSQEFFYVVVEIY